MPRLSILSFSLLVSCGSYSPPPGPPAVASAEPSDQQCSRDAECVLVQDCCGCTQGGRQLAVHRDRVEALQEASGGECADASCVTSASAHRSCDASVAQCLGGRCVPSVPQ